MSIPFSSPHSHIGFMWFGHSRVHTGKLSKIQGLLKTNLQFSGTKNLGKIMIEVWKFYFRNA